MKLSMRRLLTDEKLLGPIYGAESFEKQVAIMCSFLGEELSDRETEIMRELTGGRTMKPGDLFNVLCMVLGRRSDKTKSASALSIKFTVCADYRDKLAPGEVATCLLLAADKKQARNAMRYARGMIDSTPLLGREVVRMSDESIVFANRSCIEISTASFRATRGYTLCAAICDEIAFWRDAETSRNPDVEIIAAIRPGLATLGGPLIMLSSPHARRGILWDTFRRHYAQDDSRTLVVRAPTWEMNPTLPRDSGVIAEAFEQDPERAAAEWGAEFRSDLEAFVSMEVVEGAERSGHPVLPPSRMLRYTAFVDPSGGSADSMTLAIAHREHRTDRVIIDLVLERKPPFSPEAVVEEFSRVLHEYRCTRVIGDAYAGQWPREQFSKRRIRYDTSEQNKTQLYQGLLPLLNSGTLELPPDPTLRRQLLSLERRVTRGGRELIDHQPGSHDDVANAVAGAAVLARKPPAAREINLGMAY